MRDCLLHEWREGKRRKKLGLVVLTCNSALKRLMWEDCDQPGLQSEFQACLDHRTKLCLKLTLPFTVHLGGSTLGLSLSVYREVTSAL